MSRYFCLTGLVVLALFICTSAVQSATDEKGPSGDSLMGKPAPAFTLTGLDGKKISSKSLTGDVYILDFWATWCPPCRMSLPELNGIYNDMKDKGLKVFAVNQGETKNKVQAFVKSTNLTVPVLLDTHQSVGKKYLAEAIPETVVVGKDGNVSAVFFGSGHEDEIRQAAQDAMK